MIKAVYWRTSVARIANTGYASLTILATEVRQYIKIALNLQALLFKSEQIYKGKSKTCK